MEKKYDPRLDLIRAVSTLCVLFAHFIDFTGIYEIDIPIAQRALGVWLRMLLGCCVGMFLMLTGWLCSEKKLSGRYYLGFLRIYEIFLISSVFTFLYQIFVEHEQLSLSYMIGSIINVYSCPYAWYLLMYMGLFLMIPFLNLAFNGLETDRQRLVLVGTFLYLSILPSALNMKMQLLSVWWKNLYPIAYYYTGAYLRRRRPRLPVPKLLALLVASVSAFVALDYALYGPSGSWAIVVTYHDSWQCYITAVISFLLLLRLGEQMPARLGSAAKRLAELSLAVYLLSGITDAYIYPRLRAAVAPGRLLLCMVPVSLLSFAGALLLARLAVLIQKPLDRLVHKLLYRLFPSLRPLPAQNGS